MSQYLSGDLPKKCEIQTWLERIPQKKLMNTQYGIPNDTPPAREEVFEDPLLNQVYKMDIANFLIAEKHSVTNSAKLVLLAPDEQTQMALSTQVFDEARHFDSFSSLLGTVGVSVEKRHKLMKRYTSPEIQKFFDLLDEQLDKNNFIGGLIGQNLILEGMAYPLYRYEMKYWSYFDPRLSEVIAGAFADEVNHTALGESYLKQLLKDHSKHAEVRKLVDQFHKIMSEVFDALIRRYIGLYQAAMDPYSDKLAHIEVFKGKKMVDLSEKEQTLTLLSEIQQEFKYREALIGL